jgi:hypothetical protein
MKVGEYQNFNNFNIKNDWRCSEVNMLSGSYVICLNEHQNLELRKLYGRQKVF